MKTIAKKIKNVRKHCKTYQVSSQNEQKFIFKMEKLVILMCWSDQKLALFKFNFSFEIVLKQNEELHIKDRNVSMTYSRVPEWIDLNVIVVRQ